MNPRSIFIASVALAAIATGAWLSYRVATPPPTARAATILTPPTELPTFALVDDRSNPIGRDVFVGQWDLVFFGFTHCPDVCPLTLQKLSQARNRMAELGTSELPRIVLVSVDPERDTPERMAEYVRYFGDDTLGMTGDLEEIRKLTDGLGIFFAKSASMNGNYNVDHSAAVLLLNPNGKLHALFSSPHEVNNFVHDIPIIMARKK